MSLLSRFKVVTVTHHTLDVQEISNFFINKKSDSEPQVIQRLRKQFDIEECIYLETCNRVSFILFGHFSTDKDFLPQFFQIVNPDLKPNTLDNIGTYVSMYAGSQAVSHIFELASSIDSLVVGEREIFKQFREAYRRAQDMGAIGDNLRLLEKATVATAKKIYSQTKIGEKALSVVSLAIRKMMENNPGKKDKILLIGTGETNQLVSKFLKKYEFDNIHIYNRSINNARDLAEMLDAQSYHINELSEVRSFDIVIICTSANKVIIDLPLYQKMLNSDKSKKLLIDLSVPRNIDAEVVDHCNTEYIDIQSLKEIAEKNLQFRKKEIQKAKPIIEEQVLEFGKLLQDRQIELALSHIPQEISSIKRRALDQVYKSRIENLNPEAKKLVMDMMDYMEKKCVSVPMKLSKNID